MFQNYLLQFLFSCKYFFLILESILVLATLFGTSHKICVVRPFSVVIGTGAASYAERGMNELVPSIFEF